MTESGGDQYEQFLKILGEFEHAMLVTRQGQAMRSRPMAVAESTADGKLWFMSNAGSGKHAELAEDPNVNVAMQGQGRFLSVTGTARVLRDPDRAEQLWSESQRAWFPEGPRDARLALIEVVPSSAEYWDRSGENAVQFTFAEARARAGGRALGDDEAGDHGSVNFGRGG